MFAHQRRYINDLVQIANLSNDKIMGTPMELNVKCKRDDGDVFDNPLPYRQLWETSYCFSISSNVFSL